MFDRGAGPDVLSCSIIRAPLPLGESNWIILIANELLFPRQRKHKGLFALCESLRHGVSSHCSKKNHGAKLQAANHS